MKPYRGISLLQNLFRLSNHIIKRNVSSFEKDVHLKLSYLLNSSNLNNSQDCEVLKTNATRRGCAVNIEQLTDMYAQFKANASELDEAFLQKFHKELLKLPNNTCPKSMDLSEPKIIEVFGEKRILENAFTLEQLSHHGVDLTTGNFTGSHSYYLKGSMAQLESKLVTYALRHLKSKGFTLMSVPDILYESILASCGVPVDGERTMVYSLDPNHIGLPADANTSGVREKVSLAGTAEMALGGWLQQRCFTEDQLPLKLCAVSRCYRAERSRIKEEQGIFRVHHFTKVEMFGVTANETGRESDELYKELLQTQIALLTGLGLHGQVVLMPPEELGNPAFSKTDMEVWLPGRGRYAELTSASNCTSYQAARLGATYVNSKGRRKLVHTVNGTAIAVPRCIIALCETHQEATGRRALMLPKVLGLPSARNQPRPPPSVVPAGSRANETESLASANQDQSVAGVEEDEFLEKIMVYNEQCLRKSFPGKKYRDLIVPE